MAPRLRGRAKTQVKPKTQMEPSIPEHMKNIMANISKRFEFNISQIEQKYCGQSSGLVFDLETEEMVFDENLCTIENDQSLINAAKKQFAHHTLDEFGGAIISAPAVDEQQKDPKMLNRVEKLNDIYKVFLKASKKPEIKTAAELENVQPPAKVQRIVKDEPKQQLALQPLYPSAFECQPTQMPMFSQSIAESHEIDEPCTVPLQPRKRTFNQTYPASTQLPYSFTIVYEGRMTRSRTKQLQIETEYEKRADVIFAHNVDWVDRWADHAALNTSSGQFEEHEYDDGTTS
ncbi:hypothetical protein M3Y98_00803900 [Aphelenchoides besseyi]|nr:hypothetical protein M3Y98_00803900 [Aphelenchoides besseyi]KAI6212064.1 hypothetical protein M3Y96_00500700 [Aphelenchoides besseyi]